MVPSAHASGSSYLAIISAMITPAILILASGSLVTSTLVRLARIVDRARTLVDRIVSAQTAPVRDDRMLTLLHAWLTQYRRRASFAERALSFYYTAIGLFVAGSLAITIDDLTRDSVPWLSFAFVVIGAIALFAGTAALVIETSIATGQLRNEIDELVEPIAGEGDA